MLRAFRRERHAAGSAECREAGVPIEIVVELVVCSLDEKIVNGHRGEEGQPDEVTELAERARGGHTVALGDLEADMSRPYTRVRNDIGSFRIFGLVKRLIVFLHDVAVELSVHVRAGIRRCSDVGGHGEEEGSHPRPSLLGRAELCLVRLHSTCKPIQLRGDLTPHPLGMRNRVELEGGDVEIDGEGHLPCLLVPVFQAPLGALEHGLDAIDQILSPWLEICFLGGVRSEIGERFLVRRADIFRHRRELFFLGKGRVVT